MPTNEHTIRVRYRLKPGRPYPADLGPDAGPQDTVFTGTLHECELELRAPAPDHPDLERVIVHGADYPVAEEVRAVAKECGIGVVDEKGEE